MLKNVEDNIHILMAKAFYNTRYKAKYLPPQTNTLSSLSVTHIMLNTMGVAGATYIHIKG